VVVVGSLNRGSSSLKYALYRFDDRDATLVTSGTLEGRGQSSLDGALDAIERGALDAGRTGTVDAIGHRIVHGGPDHDRPALVDDDLLEDLRRLSRFAPLHLPAEIEDIELARARLPQVRQVACFDTAFHRRLPEVAQRLPLPARYYDEGIRRYGFHGLSYEYVSSAIDAARLGRVVIAHLGNGASMVALLNGMPVHTTMAFTPIAGLVMGSRCGDLDPGAVLHLVQQSGPDEIEHVLNHESGLVGLSGTTGDMRELLTARGDDPDAALAVQAFVRSAAMHVGALAAVLGGLDVLVFTGGIGEHAATVRAELCAALAHLGIGRVTDANEHDGRVITSPDSAVVVMVLPTDEELTIARHTADLVARSTTDS
jgi:acetate kinase